MSDPIATLPGVVPVYCPHMRPAGSLCPHYIGINDTMAPFFESASPSEEAERQRYGLGESTLFVLNQRELQTADAQLRQVSALSRATKIGTSPMMPTPRSRAWSRRRSHWPKKTYW